MPRSPAFALALRALSAAGLHAPGPRALTRRSLLKAAGAAALAGCAPTEMPRGGRIAIIGGGAAGLTTAYRLKKSGRSAQVFEASGRLGGRMFTRRDFNSDGQFCELGGELVDTNHEALRALAGELGVGIDRLRPEGARGESLFQFGGRIYAQHDMLANGAGAFAPIAQRIGQDRAALLTPDGEWTDAAKQLDGVSLADYLAGFRGQAPDWAIALLDVAYQGEMGLPCAQLSSLNIVDFIGLGPEGFEMYGDSDEAWRIRGGSSSLIEALAAQLTGEAAPKLGFKLKGISRTGGAFALDFDTQQGAQRIDADLVVLALPFTMLRALEGLDALGLADLQLQAIRELGMGDNAKLMVGATSRPWQTQQPGWPAPANGEFYSERFQLAWETSRGQLGARGILTNFLSGVQDEAAALAAFREGLAALSPAMAQSLDPANKASFFWARYPFTAGSYAAAKTGQYTTLIGHFEEPILDGALYFAGEQTSAVSQGFMNGAVESGERTARAILGA